MMATMFDQHVTGFSLVLVLVSSVCITNGLPTFFRQGAAPARLRLDQDCTLQQKACRQTDPNSVCCQDGLHCCPADSDCTLNGCIQHVDMREVDFCEDQHKSPHSQRCNDFFVCSQGSCCQGYGQWFCCPELFQCVNETMSCVRLVNFMSSTVAIATSIEIDHQQPPHQTTHNEDGQQNTSLSHTDGATQDGQLLSTPANELDVTTIQGVQQQQPQLTTENPGGYETTEPLETTTDSHPSRPPTTEPLETTHVVAVRKEINWAAVNVLRGHVIVKDHEIEQLSTAIRRLYSVTCDRSVPAGDLVLRISAEK